LVPEQVNWFGTFVRAPSSVHTENSLDPRILASRLLGPFGLSTLAALFDGNVSQHLLDMPSTPCIGGFAAGIARHSLTHGWLLLVWITAVGAKSEPNGFIPNR